MKSLTNLCFVLALVLLATGFTSPPDSETIFTAETGTVITRTINEEAQRSGLEMNYFTVSSVAFDSQKEETIGGQRQNVLTFSYVCKVVNANKFYREGDSFRGRGTVRFINSTGSQWVLHDYTITP